MTKRGPSRQWRIDLWSKVGTVGCQRRVVPSFSLEDFVCVPVQ